MVNYSLCSSPKLLADAAYDGTGGGTSQKGIVYESCLQISFGRTVRVHKCVRVVLEALVF
jgi:hypothetical protein